MRHLLEKGAPKGSEQSIGSGGMGLGLVFIPGLRYLKFGELDAATPKK